MKKSTNPASVGNIARLAGVSTAATSFALNNQPGVSPATRERILRIAKELGYAPDARIGTWMARVRDAKSKDLLPIAWLNTAWDKDTWRRHRFHSPYLEGASTRAMELGYKLDEIWAHEPGMTMQRLARILYQRRIEGVIVTHPARHFRLNWEHLACVTLGASLLAPRLHRVMADLNFNLQLALKSLRRLGYRRIGICLMQEIDNASHYTIRATAQDLYSNTPRAERIPALFHQPYWKKRDGKKNEMVTWLKRHKPEVLGKEDDRIEQWAEATGFGEKDKGKEMMTWLKRYKPEVIVGHDGHLKEWAEEAGYRVPEDIGIVHLAVDDDVLDWAGIHSRRRETGATAVDQLVALMRNHQFGVPKTPLNILIRGSWQNGQTLLSPRARGKKTTP